MRLLFTGFVAGALICTATPATAQYRQGFNCGSGTLQETLDGAVYSGDRDYTSENGSGRVGGRNGGSGSDGEIGGLVGSSQTRRLLTARREGWDSYIFDVPNGSYLISMHFMEPSHHWKILREFSIEAEGEVLISDLDIFDVAERKFTHNIRRVVDVLDERLEISATATIGESIIQGIHVEEVVDTGIAPPVPEGLRAVPSYGEVVLFWDTAYERTQLGVDIWRQDLTLGEPEIRITDDPASDLFYRDQTAVPGHEYRYRMTAVDGAGNASDPTETVTTTALLFSDSPVEFHELTVDDEDYKWLAQNRNSDDTVPATYRIDGQEFDDCDVRFRGNTTRDLIKKNYKVKTDGDDPFPPGRIKLNLQSELRVASPMREKLAYDLFEDAAAMAGEANYINLMRNDEYVGIYDDFEQVDEYFLERRGLEGSLWKADSDEIAGDFTVKNMSAYYDDYVLEVGTYEDYEYLDDFLRMVNQGDDGRFRTDIFEYLDVDEWLLWYSSQAIVANWDHVVHNYYLYRERDTGIFHFIPWDLELGWDSPGQAINYGTRAHRWFLFFYNRLYDRLMTTDNFRRMYAVTLENLLEDTFSEERIQDLIQADYDLIRPDMERDLLKEAWEDMGPFDDDLEDMKDFISARVVAIRNQLSWFSTDPMVNLYVNEALTTNVNGLRDEAGDADPWVEIYNLGNETIDLGGLGLSDDPQDPGRWLFPDGTTINARSHLLVWLDDEPDEGDLHASFRISDATTAIGLYYPNGSEISKMGIVAGSVPDLSTGRTPDAGSLIFPMVAATPNAANDRTHHVECTIEADAADYYRGSDMVLTATLANQREFPWNLKLEVVAIGSNDVQYPILSSSAALLPYEEWSEELTITIPELTPPSQYELAIRVLTRGGTLIDEYVTAVNVFDPAPVTLVINEIMADNETTIDDRAGHYDDWLEIYNSGAETVDLTGLYLSDNPENPTKWKFPVESLQSGDHLLVWCDDDQEQGWLHATFKLNNGGEDVGIYERDLRNNTVIDLVTYPELEDDIAFGRSPDGSDNLVELSQPTPGSSNP